MPEQRTIIDGRLLPDYTLAARLTCLNSEAITNTPTPIPWQTPLTIDPFYARLFKDGYIEYDDTAKRFKIKRPGRYIFELKLIVSRSSGPADYAQVYFFTSSPSSTQARLPVSDSISDASSFLGFEVFATQSGIDFSGGSIDLDVRAFWENSGTVGKYGPSSTTSGATTDLLIRRYEGEI